MGVFLLLFTKAATNSLTVDVTAPETPATYVNDASAANGGAVLFTSAPVNTQIRATFYYPWFKETWGANPFTNFHPVEGFYDNNNPDGSVNNTLFSKHIQQMTYAGFDAAIASWWGPENKYPESTHKENTRIPALLNNASNASNGKSLKWALYYEMESVGDPVVDDLVADLSYVKTNYANNAAYLKINNKPVIFVFTGDKDACPMAQRWQQANATLGFYVVLKVFSGFDVCQFQPDNWHQYAPAAAVDDQGQHSYTISPGFWLKGEAAPRLNRLDATKWGEKIDAMLASPAKFQLVTTFNEWGEGTAVEPASEWSSASGFGMYIDVLHQRLAGVAAGDTTAPSTPQNLAAAVTTSISLTWSASIDTGGSGLKGYQVYRDGVYIAAAAATNYSDSTAAAGVQYSYTVKSVDNAGNTSQASNTVTATINGTPACTANPTTPSNMRILSSTATTATLAWGASTAGAGCTLGSYMVFRSVNGATATLIASVSATTLSWTDTGISSGVAYAYYVIAGDTNVPTHQSSASNVANLGATSCSDSIAPTAPTNAGSSTTTTSATISWGASTDTSTCGLVGYKVYQVISGVDTEIATVIAGQTLQVTKSGLTASTAYTFRVKAYDSATPVNFSAPTTFSTTTQAVVVGGDVIIAIAGDIQKPRADLHYGLDTSNLILNQIMPSYVLAPGDVQYESGVLSDFNAYYAKTWGRAGIGEKVYPAPGNHDYATAGATGYYSYFRAGNNTINGNAVTGPANQGYYAFDAGNNWRIYSMNSETAGSTAAAQNTFLANDMSANPKPCTIMFAHKPYYDYGTTHDGDGNASLPWLKTLYDGNAELVFTGHEHNYQRFKRVNPYTDTVDTVRGLETFVVGTGGADNLYAPFGSTLHSANTLVATSNGVNAWGVLKLTLHANSYDWEFVPVNANAYTDSGSGVCH